MDTMQMSVKVYKGTKQYQISLCGLRFRLTLFTTCCLQPAKIPILYNAFLPCLDSFSEINLRGALPHCNPTNYQTILLILCLYWCHLLVIIIYMYHVYSQLVVFMLLDMLLLAHMWLLCIVYT